MYVLCCMAELVFLLAAIFVTQVSVFSWNLRKNRFDFNGVFVKMAVSVIESIRTLASCCSAIAQQRLTDYNIILI